MTVSRSERMQGIAGLAKKSEDQAARELGEKRRQLEMQRKRLQELTEYRDDYTKRLKQNAQQGFNAQQMNDYRTFMEKLNKAIVQQQKIIDQAMNECRVYQEKWLSKRTHTQAMDKVVDRYQQQENQLREKKEQREQDERASQAFHTRRFE